MSTRASASLIRCFSLVISSNVDILYLRGRVLVDPDRSIFLGVYHYDAHSATAECADLFESASGCRGRPPSVPANEKAIIVQERLRPACGRRRQESAALFDMTSRWRDRDSNPRSPSYGRMLVTA